MNITLSPAVAKFLSDLENLVRKSGAWAVIVNDFTRTVHVTNSGALNSVLTAVAGSLLYADHVAKKRAATPPTA